MKTTITTLVVLVCFFFAPSSLFAQYEGGIADGSAHDHLNNTVCATPAQFYAYFGGSGDGAGMESLQITACGAPSQFYAYQGGVGDGSALETINAVTCDAPSQFYAYFGGDAAGSAVDAIDAVVCDTPTQFYAYFGGDGDGYGADGNLSCPVDPPVADFMADNTTICVGDTVQFTDTSTNIPTVWEWTFEGGTPATSGLENPEVVYNTPGTYDVTLKAVNQFGTNTKILTDYITVNAIPTIATTTPGTRCDAGIVTLEATASAGTLSWFNVETGGTALGTGTSFNTPSISETTTFYVETENNGCISTRVAVIATVNDTPTITNTTPGERCGPGSVQLTAQASSGNIKWYDVAAGGTSLSNTGTFNTPSIATTTTYYVEVSANGCISPRTAVVATINSQPAITSTTDASRCGPGSVTLLAQSDFGTIKWYDAATGGNLITTGTSFTTPSLANTKVYYVEAAQGSCSSSRIAVTAEINAVPTITDTTPASRCGAGSVTLTATANAGTLSWFNVASGGTALGSGTSFTTPSITATTSFYVESNNGGCISTREEVIATVNSAPSVTSTTPASRCGTGSVTLMATASSGTLSWFATAAGGTVLGTGTSFTTPVIATTSTFYVQAQASGCTSTRTAVVATVNNTPVITNTTPASRCGAGTVTLTATANSGTLSWFNSATGGTALGTGTSFTTPSIATTTSYYVEASTASCTSVRTEVVATINALPTITSTTPAGRCDSGTVTLMATANAGTLSWYNTATGGSALGTGTSFTTPVITSTTTFYVEANNNGCISSRTAVIATVNDAPTITSTTPAERCGAGSVTLSAVADYGTIKWFTSASGGTSIFTGASFTTPSISVTTTYYVASNSGSCTSNRVPVTATINSIPAITSTTPASRCDTGTVTLMATASSGTLSWFNVPTGGTALGTGTSFTTPVISATTNFYVESNNGSCTSTRVKVIASVNDTPSITATTPASRCGSGTVTLGATASAGTLRWFASATGGSILATGVSFTTPVLTATTTYYVQATNAGCTSGRTAVVATINTLPLITNTTPASRCGAGTVTLTATASTGTLSWFNSATGGTALGTGTSFTTPSITTTTSYYVEASTASCTSVRTEVVATVNSVPTITSTTPAARCDAGTVTLMAAASAGTLSWYNTATGGTALGTGTSFTTPVITSSTTFYVEAQNNGCISSRTAVIATVNDAPSITSTTPAERCGAGSVTLTAVADYGTINWFASASGGTSIFTGSSFATPSISSTTTYYVSAKSGSCTSDRVAVIATVKTVPTIVTTTPASRCDAGTVTLMATASAGTLSWYNVATGGTALGTGTSFTTPAIATTTSYFVESANAGCISNRVEVVATVNTTPSVTSTTPASRCDQGTVTLMATASAGTLSWFANATGGTSLGTGTSFTTPVISSTTTFYVEAENNGCNSSRTAVIATVNDSPTITNSSSAERCGTGSVTLTASTDFGTINWFANATGGTSLFTGPSFTTPSISNTTTYYVSATSGSCTSERVAVTATIKTIPTIISTTPASRCDAGTVTLMAQASAGTLSWFNMATGGTALGTGTSFTTPVITATTTFYVEAENNGCISSRTAVVATINGAPTITGTTPAERCGPGSVTLSATADAGTINWFANATGGTSLFTGASFTTPSISSTTTYYVSSHTGNCQSDRVAVIATINEVPVITSTTPASRCDAGTVTLMAAASSGTLSWYNVATGGTALGTGTSFTTPVLTATTSFYVESANVDCTSVRVEVIATVNATPTIISTTPASRCDEGTVTLMATASAGTLSWFNVATGGTSLGTGTSFTTPVIAATTSFYVEVENNGCVSSRTEVVATVNDSPEITDTTPAERCGEGTVTLMAATNTGNISWFDVATGGTVLGTGTTFTTSSISETTSYFVESESNGCISERVEVIATVNITEAPTGEANQTFCAGETVGLIVTDGVDVIWYDAPTNGNIVPDDTLIVDGTTYYGSQTIDGCESTNRLAVTMTTGGCLGVSNNQMLSIKVYPVPMDEVLNIQSNDIISSIELYDVLGKLIFTMKTNSLTATIDTSLLASGTYLVVIRAGNKVGTHKVLKM